MQGNHRLAAARRALDDQDSLKRRADDGVLLGLHCGDDVVHPARAARGERRHEHSAALHVLGLDTRVTLRERREVEHVILERGDLASGRHDVAAAYDAPRISGRRLIKRLGRGRAPVGEQRALLVIGETETADVTRLAVGEIKPAEAQPGLRSLQCLEPLGIELDESILLGHGRRGPGRLIVLGPAEVLTGAATQLVESVVEGTHHRAFGGELALSADPHGMPPDQGEDRSCRTSGGMARRGLRRERGTHLQPTRRPLST